MPSPSGCIRCWLPSCDSNTPCDISGPVRTANGLRISCSGTALNCAGWFPGCYIWGWSASPARMCCVSWARRSPDWATRPAASNCLSAAISRFAATGPASSTGWGRIPSNSTTRRSTNWGRAARRNHATQYFCVYRRTYDPHSTLDWRPLRQTTADMPLRAQVSNAAMNPTAVHWLPSMTAAHWRN